MYLYLRELKEIVQPKINIMASFTQPLTVLFYEKEQLGHPCFCVSRAKVNNTDE